MSFLCPTTPCRTLRSHLRLLQADSSSVLSFVILTLFKFFLRFYLFIHETQREAETQVEGKAGSLLGSPTRDSIPGTRDHALSQRQALHPLSHPGVPDLDTFEEGWSGVL